MFRIATFVSIVVLIIVPTVCAAPVEVEPIELFNGEDLSGWTHYLGKSNKAMEDVWSVADGVLHCTGKPAGFLETEEEYTNYVLTLEWRWPEKGGNNGVLVHCTEKDELGVWPKSLEVQLASGNAGDFWVIGTEIEIENPEGRIKGRRHLNLTDDSELELGEWNTMRITCHGDKVSVEVNGELVNDCTGVSQIAGKIALQSEGTPIEYRNILLELIEEE
ncbi:MAG: 3-keto-disaccharide hydrolase [Aeoliella sp.]